MKSVFRGFREVLTGRVVLRENNKHIKINAIGENKTEKIFP